MTKKIAWMIIVLLSIWGVRQAAAQTGELDHRFGSHGIFQAPVINGVYDTSRFLAVYPSTSAYAGKIVLAGDGNVAGKTQYVTTLVRVNANGTLDTTFGTNGVATVYYGDGSQNFCAAVMIQSDDKIVVLGRHSGTVSPYGQLALARFNANGTLDNTFGTGGTFINFVGGNAVYAYGLTRQKDGKYVVVGTNQANDSYVVRVDATGANPEVCSVDMTSYLGGGGSYEQFNAVTLDDGTTGSQCVYATGTAQISNSGKYRATAVKLSSTLSVIWKKTFDFDASQPGSAGSDIKFHDFGGSMGKQVLIGGGQGGPVYCNFTVFGVAMLNTDGTFSTSFGNNGTKTVNILGATSMERIAIQSDDKILIGGDSCAFGVARLNTNGSIDTTFHGTGMTEIDFPDWNGDGEAYCLDNTGNIVACFDSYNSSLTEYYFTAVKVHAFDKAMVYVRSDADNSVTDGEIKAYRSGKALRVKVCADGSLSTISATSLTFDTAGSTNPADIASAQVYFTGASDTFDSSHPFGNPVAVAANGLITVTGSQPLAHAENYFWLVYNVAPGATPGDVLKAKYTTMVVGGAPKISTTPSPTGSITVKAPSYGPVYADDDTNDYITHVSFAGIDNESGTGTAYGLLNPSLGRAGYSDFTTQTANISRGQTYPFSCTVSTGQYWPDNASAIIVWCDWNHDYDFSDPGECIVATSPTLTRGPHTASITVPADAALGATRMRVMVVYPDNFGADPIPNGDDPLKQNLSWGEAEDYTLNITNAVFYHLAYAAGLNGSLSGTTPQTVVQGGSGSAVTAVPDTGCHFTQWSDGSTANPRTDTSVTTDVSVSAGFAINQYALSYTAGANGSLSGVTSQTVNYGAIGSAVEAVPSVGYRFVEWSDGSTANPRTDTSVTTNVSVMAGFAIRQFALVYAAGAHGSLNGQTSQTVNYGASGSAVEAVPDAGYHFTEWSDGSTANPRTESNVTGKVVVTASFAINQYTLTYAAGANGSLSGSASQTVNHGASGSAVEAVPATDYHFVEWSDGSATNPRTDANVTTSVSVTAGFAINQYPVLFLTDATAGAALDGITSQTVAHGGDCTTVTVQAPASHHFTGWKEGSADVGTTNPLALKNITAATTLTACFEINHYTLAYSAGANGSLSGTALQTVDYGTSGTVVEAVPAAGYHFTQWSDGATVNPRIDTLVTSSVSVMAGFAINQYTLKYSAGANGSLSGVTSQTINYGTAGSAVEAVPATGYHFVQWSDGSTANPRAESNVTANMNVAAEFAINTYPLIYGARPHGFIRGNQYQTVNYGASGSAVEAVPATGYHFAEWSDGSAANPRTDASVTTAVSVMAGFAINQYTLAYAAGAHGSLNGQTSQTVNYGAAGSAVEAVPETGYHFAEWSDGSTANPRTEGGVTGNVTVTANFAINQYTLKYAAEANGSLSGVTSQTVNHGASGSAVEAVPNTGYLFVRWSDNLAANPRTDTNVTSTVSVTALFALNQMAVAFRTDGTAGATLDGATTQTIAYGNDCTSITVHAPASHHFAGWMRGEDNLGTSNPLTFRNVTEETTLTAHFEINHYTLAYTAGANGSISGVTTQTVAYGGSGSSVTAVPATGYHFSQWSDGASANPRAESNVTANVNVAAEFAINTYPLAYSVGAHGSLSGNTSQTVNYGASGSAVEAVPATGYHFVQWSDGSAANPRTDASVTTAVSVAAGFAINQYSLKYSAGANGSLNGVTSQTVSHGGSGSAVEAVPAARYHFVQWSDGSKANPRTEGNVTGNVTVTASFAINQFTLAYAAEAHGSLSGSASQTVNQGENGSAVEAVPATGYHFVRWSDNLAANPRTDTNVTSNVSVTALFALNQLAVAFRTDGTAGATLDGATTQTIAYGGDCTTVTAHAPASHHFAGWRKLGADIGTTNPLALRNVTEETTLTAHYEINHYTLSYTAGANGSLSGVTLQTVIHGTSGTAVTAVPAEGYHFVHWSDGSAANPRRDAAVTTSIAVTAAFELKLVPTVTQWPAATPITYGQTLAASTLGVGAASVPGKFTFDHATLVPGAGSYSAAVTFTPDDSVNYATVPGIVPVLVNKATPSVKEWPKASALTYGQSLADSALSSGSASVSGSFAFAAPATLPGAGSYSASVIFTPADAANFSPASGSVAVTVSKATPQVTAWPTAGSIIVGQTLAASALTGGQASVAGTFAFAEPATAPAVGAASFAVIFTPSEAANYNTVSGSVSLMVYRPDPTELYLSAASIAENQAAGVLIGKLSCNNADTARTYAYTLAAGEGDADNGSFAIQGDQLRSAASFDFETKSSYCVRVQVNNGHGVFARSFTIAVTDANDAPRDILLSNAVLAEKQPAGTTVGTLSAIDQDKADTHTFTLVAGAGDRDNARFQILGGVLKTRESFDASTQGPFSIRVQADDAHGGLLERQFSITLTRAADTQAPTFTRQPVVTSITDRSALLQWETDEPAKGTVSYGKASLMNQNAAETQTLQAHQMLLNNLTSQTLYSVQVAERDAAGNGPTLSGVLQFTTRASSDVSAPVIIDGPLSTSINDTSAEIRWTTNEPSTSRVSFTDGSVIGVREDGALTVDHKIILAGLSPLTQYQYFVESTDGYGNGPVKSAALAFKTLVTPDTRPPVIIEGPLVVNRSQTSAAIAWKTDEPATGLLEVQDRLTGEKSQASSAILTTEHQLVINNLKPATAYMYHVQSYDVYGNGPASSIPTDFTTEPVPDITPPNILTGPFVISLTNHCATIYWTTDEPSDSYVEYGVDNNLSRRQGNPERTTVHQVTLVNLTPKSHYGFMISSTDASGNKVSTGISSVRKVALAMGLWFAAAADQPQTTFQTLELPDLTAPSFTDGPKAVQIGDTWAMVSWTTDEIADARLEYGKPGEGMPRFIGDINRTFEHLVMITNLDPSTQYQYRVSTQDVSGNTALGTTLTLTTVAQPDKLAPAIVGDPTVTPGATNARVQWQTDELATSQVAFGDAPSSLTRLSAVTGLRSDHDLYLTNLSEGSTYYYVIETADSSGNATKSPVRSFQTGFAPRSRDLALSMTLSPSAVTQGSRFTASFHPANLSTQAVVDTILTVTLPAHIGLEAVDTALSHTVTQNAKGCVIRLAGLAGGETATVNVQLAVDAALTTVSAPFLIRGGISTSETAWTDPVPANNAAQGTLPFNAPRGTVHAAPALVTLSPWQRIPSWQLSGPSGYAARGQGVKDLPSLVAGQYTMTWLPLHGWITPPAEAKTLATSGQSVTFSSTYQPDSANCLTLKLLTGNHYKSGDTIRVHWTSDPAVTGTAVIFQLWDGPRWAATLGNAWNTDCQGDATFLIPDSMPTGSNYRLRMFSSWDRAFWIQNSTALGIEHLNGVAADSWNDYE